MTSTDDDVFSTETDLNITDAFITSTTAAPAETTSVRHPEPTTTTKDSGLGGGATAGIVILVLFVIGAVVVIVIVVIKRRKTKLTGYNQGRRQTAPSVDDLKRAQQSSNNEDDNPADFQTQERNNPGFQPDVAQRLPMHRLQPQAPDIHISVNPEVSGKVDNDLDRFIPSPDDHRGILTSGPRYDYPHNQRGEKALSNTSNEGDEETRASIIYDHPQSLNNSHQSRRLESDGETSETEDIYDTPQNNKTITKSDINQAGQPGAKPGFVSRKHVNKIASPSKDENNDASIESKRDYINVEEWRSHGPKQHVRDSNGVQDPEVQLPLPPRNKTTTSDINPEDRTAENNDGNIKPKPYYMNAKEYHKNGPSQHARDAEGVPDPGEAELPLSARNKSTTISDVNPEDQFSGESNSVAHEHVEEVAKSSLNKDDNTEESTKEKRDYENVKEWHSHGPPPRDRDSDVGQAEDAGQMDPPPPSARGHSVTHKRRYVNVPENHELPVADNSDLRGAVEATETADNHSYVNARPYENLPIGNPLSKNNTNDNPEVSGQIATLQGEETYSCADIGQ